MSDAKELSDGVRRQTEQALVSWSRDVLEALGNVPALGPFEVKSTHKPYSFELQSGEHGLMRLIARNDDAENYSSERVCDFDIPTWLLRDESSNRLESREA